MVLSGPGDWLVNERAFLLKTRVVCHFYLPWMRTWILPTALNTAWIVRNREAILIVEVILAAQEEAVAPAILKVAQSFTVILVGIVLDPVVAQVVAVAAAVGIKESTETSKDRKLR